VNDCPAIVRVADRGTPELLWTVTVIVPVPVPLEGLIATQFGAPVAVHAHPAVVVTVTVAFPPDVATLLKLVGLIVKLQVAAAAWVTLTVVPATVTEPARAAPVFCRTFNWMVPVPEPLAPWAIEIQFWFEVAVQLQPWEALTATARLPPAAATDAVLGDTSTWHVGTGTEGLEPWLIVTTALPSARFAVRAALVLLSICSVTSALPLPLVIDGFTQATGEVIVHEQKSSVDIERWNSPPSDPASMLAGDGDIGQPAGCCETWARWSPTINAADRDEVERFGSIWIAMVPLPCPLAVDKCNHVAVVAAVHWHSRDVVSVTVPFPPAALIVKLAGPSVIPQRCSVGETSVVDPEPHAASMTAATQKSAGTTRAVTPDTLNFGIEHPSVRRAHAKGASAIVIRSLELQIGSQTGSAIDCLVPEQEEAGLEPIENPFGPNVLPMPPE
jgi:hypothetical protein